MVKLRLRRTGRKKLPIYKIVAADSRYPRDGRFIEAIAVYNPGSEPTVTDLKENRAIYWLKAGAQPTPTVRNLLSSAGILLKLHLTKKGASEQQINDELAKWQSLQENKKQNKIAKKLKRKELKKGPAKPNTEEKAEAVSETQEEAG